MIKGQKRIDQITKRVHRRAVLSLTKDISEEHLVLVSLYGMAKKVVFWDGRQPYRWTLDGTDFFTPGNQRCKFYLNVIQDTLPSHANLKTWNKRPLGSGVARTLGAHGQRTLHIGPPLFI